MIDRLNVLFDMSVKRVSLISVLEIYIKLL
jgi:hypothetical protein